MATKQITPQFVPTTFKGGERVIIEGFSHGEATFIEYGDPKHSCPETHITWPGMRIAYVQMDRYGRQPIWENRIALVS